MLEHFQNPKNVGELLNPDGVGLVCNASCGDQMFIKCNGDRISEVTFKVFGCGTAVAMSSILTEKVKGSTIVEALKISEGILQEDFCQLSKEKTTCFKLAANALRLATEEYRGKQLQPSLMEESQKDKDQQ